jgi:hypothetical protein
MDARSSTPPRVEIYRDMRPAYKVRLHLSLYLAENDMKNVIELSPQIIDTSGQATCLEATVTSKA